MTNKEKNNKNTDGFEELKTFVLQKTPHTGKVNVSKPREVIWSLSDKG